MQKKRLSWHELKATIAVMTGRVSTILALLLHVFFLSIFLLLPTRLLYLVRDHTGIVLFWICYLIGFLSLFYLKEWKKTKTPKIFIVFFGIFLGAIGLNLYILFAVNQTLGMQNLEILVIRFYAIATLLYLYLLCQWHWTEALMLKAYIFGSVT